MKKIILCLLFLLPNFGIAQNLASSSGKDFYIGWLYPTYNDQELGLDAGSPLPFFSVYVIVSSYTDNQFTISYFDKFGKETGIQNFTVGKRRAILAPLDRTSMRMTDISPTNPSGPAGEIAEWKSMHITSKKEVNVQFFSAGANSGGSYLAIPVTALGKEYVVESYHDNPFGDGGKLSHEKSAGYFMVIGTKDSSNVTITPNSTTAGGKQGVNCGTDGLPHPFTIPLRRGQCYMVKSAGASSDCTISGTTVTADEPIVVIAGHENAHTDGSDVGSINVEQRDFMVEQMLPIAYWDTTGYYGIPMTDSKDVTAGAGDEYQFYYAKSAKDPANYPDKSSIHLINNNTILEPSAYVAKTKNILNVTTPITAHSTNGGKFHVVQYDQRMQGSAPFPAPSQLTLIPQSRWAKEYLWYVPSNFTPQEAYQGYYISLICNRDDYNNDSIQIAVDNGPLNSIKSALVTEGNTWSIPGHSELIGVTKKVIAPKCYYATSLNRRPFIIYSYGFREIDADRKISVFDGKDHYFSFANPVGFAPLTGDSSSFTTAVDTQCAAWKVCATVSGKNHPKLKSITLLNDPGADFIDKPQSKTGYVSYNVRFSSKDDPQGHGEIALNGKDSNACVSLFVSNPLDSAYAAILFIDESNNYYVQELRYKAIHLNDKIYSTDFDVTQAPWEILDLHKGTHRDSLLFPLMLPGKSNCATIAYYNTGDSSNGDPSVTINKVSLGAMPSSFKISNPPTFPLMLRPKSASHPADTLKMNICFTAEVDTTLRLDTVTVSTDCFDASILVFGKTGTGIIKAADYSFGSVPIGAKSCYGRITVRNIGTFPFTLFPEWKIDEATGKEFSMDPVSAARLPYILYPQGDPNHSRHDSINLYFCYAPTDLGHDSTIVTWNTDIPVEYANQIKSWSYLTASGVKPGVIWDREVERVETFQNEPQTRRVHLLSSSNAPSFIEADNGVRFEGVDKSEFAMAGNQMGFNPFAGFIMNPGDTIWVDYTFTPDLTKDPSIRYADRHAQLVVVFFTDAAHTKTDSSVIEFTGIVDSVKSGVIITKGNSFDELSAYYSNGALYLHSARALVNPAIELYDILGRKIKSWRPNEIRAVEGRAILPTPVVTDGVYILRIVTEGKTKSVEVRIVKP